MHDEATADIKAQNAALVETDTVRVHLHVTARKNVTIGPRCAHGFGAASLPDLEPRFELVEESRREDVTLNCKTDDGGQRSSEHPSGTEGGAECLGLDVQVDTDAEHGVLHLLTAHARLHQRPGDLLVIHDDIVRPLDPRLHSLLLDRAHEGERCEEREQRQLTRPQRRAEEH